MGGIGAGIGARRRVIGGIVPRLPWAMWEPPADGPLYGVFVPDRVYCSLQQHIGKPCVARVKPGDDVRVGQILGECESGLCAPVHAGVSGRVAEIRDMPLPGGRTAPTVIIDNDRRERRLEHIGAPAEARTRAEIVRAVHRAGVVGMGGAAFPTHKKLDPGDKDIDLVVVNGAECEPGMWGDDALLRCRSGKVVSGCAIALRATGAERAIIAIEKDKPQALAAMRSAAAADRRIVVQALPKRYPVGGEMQLIYALTGREYPKEDLPSDCGAVLINVATAAAVADAVLHSQPLVRRLCTVTGAVARPGVLDMPIGCLIRDVLAHCGGATEDDVKLVVGGPMMGQAVCDLDTPLVKASAGILVIPRRLDRTTEPEMPCIRCNRCVEACPMRLVPYQIDRYARKDDIASCRRLQTTSCINCGCCSYVCPSRIPLAAAITAMVGRLKALSGGGS